MFKDKPFLRGVYWGIMTLYALFLVYMVWNDWPHSAGWFAAAVWFIAYMFTQETLDGMFKICHDCLEGWKSTLKDLEMAHKIVKKFEEEKKAVETVQQ